MHRPCLVTEAPGCGRAHPFARVRHAAEQHLAAPRSRIVNGEHFPSRSDGRPAVALIRDRIERAPMSSEQRSRRQLCDTARSSRPNQGSPRSRLAFEIRSSSVASHRVPTVPSASTYTRSIRIATRALVGRRGQGSPRGNVTWSSIPRVGTLSSGGMWKSDHLGTSLGWLPQHTGREGALVHADRDVDPTGHGTLPSSARNVGCRSASEPSRYLQIRGRRSGSMGSTCRKT